MAAIVTLVSRYFLNFLVIFEVAVAIAQVIGLLVAFTLNRWLVFETGGRLVVAELARFSMVNVFSLTLSIVVSSLCYRLIFPELGLTFYPELTAQIVGLAACLFPSYFGHKLFTFRRA
jgi:putative flippase GtrA